MPIAEPLPDLGALSLFVTVGEVGSITAAARIHSITQPAASMRLRALERTLGVRLLARDRTGTRLTPAGATTVEWASAVLHELRRLLAGTEALRRDQRSQLRLAASMTVAEYLLPGWLLQLAVELPDTAVSLEMGNSARVVQFVVDGSVDVGIIEGPEPPTGLVSRDLCFDELVVVVGRSHAWARRRGVVTPELLARSPLIVREHGSGTRDVLTSALAEHGLQLVAAMELGSTTAIKAAVIAGAAPAVMSPLAVQGEVESGQLVEIRTEKLRLRRTLRAIWVADRPPAGAAMRLISIADSLGRVGT